MSEPEQGPANLQIHRYDRFRPLTGIFPASGLENTASYHLDTGTFSKGRRTVLRDDHLSTTVFARIWTFRMEGDDGRKGGLCGALAGTMEGSLENLPKGIC